jgi:large conductance mechanosensitive channel
MGIIKEFKDFAVRGNLVDTAVAFILGASFGKIVSAFVEGMVMPLASLLTGGVDFKDSKWVIKPGLDAIKDADGNILTPAVAEVAVKYGVFVSNVIDFIIVAFVVFLVIKAINKMKKAQPEAAPAGPSSTDALLMEIRDALKK